METSMEQGAARSDEWVTPWPGASVIVRQSTGSTMDDARGLARRGYPTGTVAVARVQEQGRGRVPGRTWHAAAGSSLLATVIWRFADLGFPLSQLPLRAGVAAALGIEDACGVHLEIKWPNDLMWLPAGAAAGKKVAGLLCEAYGDADQGDTALIGMGVNCSQKSFPPELAESACSLLQATGRDQFPSTVLAAILHRLKSSATLESWREVLRARLYRLGEVVRVEPVGSGSVIEGRLSDVDEAGRLVLELSDGQLRAIAQGELRPWS